MPLLLEYALLAILGSAPATGGALSNQIPTLDADAIAQPAGGTAGESGFTAGLALMAQDTGGCKGMSKTKPETGKKPLHHARSGRHHKGRTTRNAIKEGGTGKKPSSSQ